MDGSSELLTFAALDRRIESLPEGPVAELNAPRWQRRLDAVGYAGIVVGLMPSVMMEFIAPAGWMLWMARVGLTMTACLLPGFARNVFLVLRGMGRWRPELVAQLDHDMGAMETLHAWLARQPRAAIESHLGFARNAQARMTQKMGFLFGGADKAGVVLVLAAVAAQLKAYADGPIAWWIALPGILVAVLAVVGMVAGLMRLRLQLYEAILDDALRRRG